MKILLFLVITIMVCQSCLSQNDPNKGKLNCYQEKIRWFTKDKAFKDTTLLFRNYIDGNKDKRIVCKTKLPDKNIENLIWNCKYIASYLQYLERLNEFAFISYQQLDNENTIVSFYLCSYKSKESYDMTTFKVANNKIVGIIVLPPIFKEFIPIEKFDNALLDRVD